MVGLVRLGRQVDHMALVALGRRRIGLERFGRGGAGREGQGAGEGDKGEFAMVHEESLLRGLVGRPLGDAALSARQQRPLWIGQVPGVGKQSPPLCGSSPRASMAASDPPPFRFGWKR
ncbi:hypothetical protein D3C78_1394420 [compost metagenome]